MTLDIGNDAAIADGAESVTVTLKRGDGETALPITGALRRALARPHGIYANVALTGDELVWNIPHYQLDDARLQRGDTITDTTGAVWTILTCALLTLNTRWRCVCRKEL